MAAKEEAKTKPQNPEEEDSETESEPEPKPESSLFLDSDAEPEAGDENLPFSYTRRDGTVYRGYIHDPITENTREANIARYTKFLDSDSLRRMEEALEKTRETEEQIFNFPPDPENWKEEDLKELWADAPLSAIKPGWDPHFVDEDDVEIIHEEIEAGRDPPIAPFYLPYRRFYPVIPNNHHDITNPKAVIEELDRIEEFLIWVSYIFPDGSSYEGTVWDDLAHGKGVRVGEHGLVRYEGEWVRNEMEGHGVAEVEIPTMQPIPGSKLEAKMRAEGQIITRDFMSPEDREWLEMDIEDSVILANRKYEIPFYETDEWIREYGAKPEKGRYRYAGQWKHGRMHGCGVYEVNERTTYGRFYFGEFLEEPHGCDEEASALHAGIAEVAAAKARMFVNKPDGMVREASGPYSDPQHPYFYEEEDVWMAPGFINQFYEVPDYWKMYVHEVDQEREMWLNSFYKAPLRIPMPSELEYWWWHKDEEPEFVLINKEPEPDPEDPSKLIYSEDPLILHTPTGRIINYVDDEEHGIRLFWQPELKEGEDIDPDKAEMLPLGFGEEEDVEDNTFRTSQEKGVENAFESDKDRFNKWRDEKIKPWEMKAEILAKELELAEAELSLKVAIDELDEKLKLMEKEEENKVEEEVEGQDTLISEPVNQLEKTPPEAEEEEEEEEDEDDGNIPSSFGSIEDQKPANNNQQGSNSGKSTFAASSLSFAGSNLVSLVPQKLQNSFLRWKEGKFLKPSATAILLPTSELHHSLPKKQSSCTIAFPPAVGKSLKLKYARQIHHVVLERMPKLSLRNCSKRKSSVESGQLLEPFNILSLHTPVKI